MKILIIEDESDLRSVLKGGLKDEGYIVDTEDNGTDGLLRIQHFDYDLIILDVMLPGMDGWNLLKRLRVIKDTPVLILSARDSPDDRIRGLNLGSDDYMVKPFELGELKARVRALLRRSQGSPSPIIQLSAEVTLDTNSRRVFKNGVDVGLPMKELNMLEIFVQRRGRVVPRDVIEELFCEGLEDSDSNVIEVYIYKLRTKLGHAIIKTRRGIGYELPNYP